MYILGGSPYPLQRWWRIHPYHSIWKCPASQPRSIWTPPSTLQGWVWGVWVAGRASLRCYPQPLKSHWTQRGMLRSVSPKHWIIAANASLKLQGFSFFFCRSSWLPSDFKVPRCDITWHRVITVGMSRWEATQGNKAPFTERPQSPLCVFFLSLDMLSQRGK